MIELGGRRRLGLQTQHVLGGGQMLGPGHLQSHHPVELSLPGLVDDAHAAPGDLAQQLVVAHGCRACSLAVGSIPSAATTLCASAPRRSLRVASDSLAGSEQSTGGSFVMFWRSCGGTTQLLTAHGQVLQGDADFPAQVFIEGRLGLVVAGLEGVVYGSGIAHQAHHLEQFLLLFLVVDALERLEQVRVADGRADLAQASYHESFFLGVLVAQGDCRHAARVSVGGQFIHGPFALRLETGDIVLWILEHLDPAVGSVLVISPCPKDVGGLGLGHGLLRGDFLARAGRFRHRFELGEIFFLLFLIERRRLRLEPGQSVHSGIDVAAVAHALLQERLLRHIPVLERLPCGPSSGSRGSCG